MAMQPRRAWPSGMKKLNPVKRRQIPIRGKVVRSRFLRPNVSIVLTAGMATGVD